MECRFCKDNASKFKLIKYAVRHYAHADCGLRHKGAGFFDLLKGWQLENVPYFAATKTGFAEELEQRIAKHRAAEKSAPIRPSVLRPKSSSAGG